MRTDDMKKVLEGINQLSPHSFRLEQLRILPKLFQFIDEYLVKSSLLLADNQDRTRHYTEMWVDSTKVQVIFQNGFTEDPSRPRVPTLNVFYGITEEIWKPGKQNANYGHVVLQKPTPPKRRDKLTLYYLRTPRGFIVYDMFK